MPPKKSGRKVAQTAPPLDGCTIALSGTFPGFTQPAIENDFINALGASLSKTVNSETTHLVTNDVDFAKPSTKVKQAKTRDIQIVKLAWLEDCLDQAKRLSEDDYSFDTSNDTPDPPAANGKANGVRKRTAVASDDESQSQTQPKKKTKSKKNDADDENSQSHTKANAKNINGSQQSQAAASTTVKSEPKKSIQSKLKTEAKAGEANIAKPTDAIRIPMDETCHLIQYSVYIDNAGVIYDASLNQTNASNNNNKFYRLQLLRNGSDYKTWTRWGRVGERGQSAVLGSGSLDHAMREFEKKFKDKTGLHWVDRGANPKVGKFYTFIERSYVDSDDDVEEDADAGQLVKPGERLKTPESTLPKAVQSLMELIFNQQYFAATMTDLNYDVNKMPLGKLSKNTIIRGYQALKDLSALLDNVSLAQTQYGTNLQDAAEQLSNSFYSLIPHAFGRNRPPVIQSHDALNKEIELLDSLIDLKDAQSIMKGEPKDVEKVNALDRQFKGLNLDEMTPLKRGSIEFLELFKYLRDTRGSTHNMNYEVTDIFRIERKGEKDRFEKSPFAGPPRDRRLLWHGSRATNFGGILSQGLRIAPPEAPVSGYMFGKGIYLADMSSKSANYCCHHVSNGHALLLLCEAELGDPMLQLTDASYSAGEDAKAKGMHSTWGMGTTGPRVWKDAGSVHPSLEGVKMPDTTHKPGPTNVDNAYLLYNEYITYDVAQVRLRYLFRVKM